MKIYIVRSRLDPHVNKLALGIFATYDEAESFRQKILTDYKVAEHAKKLVYIQEEIVNMDLGVLEGAVQGTKRS